LIRSDSNPNINEDSLEKGHEESLEDLEDQPPALEKYSSTQRRFDQQMKNMALKMRSSKYNLLGLFTVFCEKIESI